MLYTALFILRSPQDSLDVFDLAGPNQLVTPLDLPTFAADFESSSLPNLPSFRKHSPTTLSTVRFWHTGCRLHYQLYTQCNQLSDLCTSHGTLERFARFFSLLLLLFLLPFTFRGRRCIFVARTPGLIHKSDD